MKKFKIALKFKQIPAYFGNTISDKVLDQQKKIRINIRNAGNDLKRMKEKSLKMYQIGQRQGVCLIEMYKKYQIYITGIL